MANVFIEASTMTAIGDAIRAKTGGMAQIYPEDMPAQIASITTGGSGDGSDLVRYVTFLDEDGSELYRMPVLVGDDCKDPVTHGDISKPTKESTNTQVFTYSGWTSTVGGTADADILKNITADKTVYVAYAVSVRYYTVTFYANDALFETVQVEYGGTATPTSIPIKDGYSFSSWDPSPTNVTADMNCYAVWVEGIKFATASWAKISEICEAGEAEQYFKLGDKKAFTVSGDSKTYYAVIIGFNHDDKADGSGKAGITCRFGTTVTPGYTAAADTNGRWSSVKVRTTYYGVTLWGKIESELRSVIKQVTKRTYSKAANGYETTNDYLWNLSGAECGFTNYPDEGAMYPIFEENANKSWTKSLTATDLLLTDSTYGGYIGKYVVRTTQYTGTYANVISKTEKSGEDTANWNTENTFQASFVPCFCI